MESDSMKAIQLAIIYIKNDNIEKLSKVLDVMPLEKLQDESDVLLSTFLSVCSSYDRPDAVRIILKRWKVIYPKDEQIQLLSRLFMTNSINISTLAYVVLMHKTYTYVELMDDLMAADNSEEVVSACDKADQVFGKQPYETYNIIREHASEMGNWRVEEYAIANMEENAPYAPKPTWVKNYTNNPLVRESELYIPSTGSLQFELPPDEEAVELLTKGLSQLGISISDLEAAKTVLSQRLSISTREEKIELLRPIMENQRQYMLGGDVWLFRLFGPANPLVNQDLTKPGKSNMYAGCRMLLDNTFCFVEDDNYYEDWFKGVCEMCHLKVAYRWYAVRKPRSHGGWTCETYCSWKCVRDSMVEYEEEPDLLVHELIDIFEKEIIETGIQDRLI